MSDPVPPSPTDCSDRKGLPAFVAVGYYGGVGMEDRHFKRNSAKAAKMA